MSVGEIYVHLGQVLQLTLSNEIRGIWTTLYYPLWGH